MSEMLWNPLLVFLGGGLGAVSRYLVTTFIVKMRAPVPSPSP